MLWLRPSSGDTEVQVKKVMMLFASLALIALPAAAAVAQESHVVETQDNVFVPEEITISVGDSIEFENTGRAPHTATAEDGSFDTGNLNAGQSRTITFNEAGTIEYICIYHESLGMVGTIVVEDAGTAASPSPAAAATPAASPQPSPEPEPEQDGGTAAVAVEEAPGDPNYGPLAVGGAGLVAAAALAGLGFSKNRKASR
ncbi:MAG: cupredoxin domain-containing protein [Actinobacteria bacterium]|nr:cupredoxin domain-containing protein [Actinomycetota bacterium]